MKRFFVFGAMLLCAVLSAWAQFSGQGSGTTTDPYRITNAAQLSQMANFLNMSNVVFRLENDIDLTEWIEENNPEEGWTSIGVKDYCFQGTFDGNGHTICGLRGSVLFGYLKSASVKDLFLITEEISIGSNGTIAGHGDAAKISNCHVKVNSVTRIGYFGGIIAFAYNCTITSCSVQVDITYNGDIAFGFGGIVCYMKGGDVNNCCFNGNLFLDSDCNAGHGAVGGIVGVMSGGTVRNNLVVGTISLLNIKFTRSFCGGIVGKVLVGSNYAVSNITKNLMLANLYGVKDAAGISCNKDSSRENPEKLYKNVVACEKIETMDGTAYRITNDSYADCGANGTNDANRVLLTTKLIEKGVEVSATNSKLHGMTTGLAALQSKDNYVAWGWDFDKDWDIQDGQSFPYKKYQAAPPVVTSPLKAGAKRVEGSCATGGTVYLLYNGKTTPVSTTCSGTQFSFTTEPLEAGSEIKVYADNGVLPSIPVKTAVSTEEYIYVTSVSLGTAQAKVERGKTLQLSASIAPANAEVKRVEWTSGNSNVATVSNTGLVTAKANGTAVITCAAQDGSGVKATCTITVTDPIVYVTSVTLNKSSISLLEGKTEKLTATVSPSNATDKSVTWQSSNTQVATVSSTGLVTAKKAGTAAITCKAKDGSGKQASCTVTVKAIVLASSIGLSEYSVELVEGAQKQLVATVLPNEATDKSVAWETDDDHIVLVSQTGLLTAVEAGMATVTCKALDGSGVKAECIVSVIAAPKAKGNGTLEDPFNALAAIQKASELSVGETSSERYYVAGKISGIKYFYSAQYGTATFYLSETGTSENQFYVYGSYYLENKPWQEGYAQIALGDDVIVYGKISNYNGTLEMANKENYVYSHNGKTSSIENVVMDKTVPVKIFTLTGQKLAAPKKGINIINGRKVVIR